ncbi:hypothetical protein ACM6XU_000726 [Vibrio parahaemolyticus]
MSDFDLESFNTYMLELIKIESQIANELCNKAERLSATFEGSLENPFANEAIQNDYSFLLAEMTDFEKSLCHITILPQIYPHIARAYLNSNNNKLATIYALTGYDCSKLSTCIRHDNRDLAIKSYRVLMDIAILTGAYETLLGMHNHALKELNYHQLDITEIALSKTNLKYLSPQQLKVNEAGYKAKLLVTDRASTLKYLRTPEATNLETAIRSYTKMTGCTREKASFTIKHHVYQPQN